MPHKPPAHNAKQVQANREATRRQYEATPARKADRQFYNGPAWRALREAHLRSKPLCEHCEAKGLLVPAQHVHHVKPRHEHPELALDESNLQGLCLSCHSRHEALGRGGVGGVGRR